MARYSKIAGQVLALLSNGILLGYSRDRTNRRQILRECEDIWHKIEREDLFRILRILRLKGLIKVIERADGKMIAEVTNRGRDRINFYKLNELSISKPKQWDKKWRVVIFDVPEEKRKIRNALRARLKNLGFFELQKSVFVHPYDCANEIDILIKVFRLHANVRLMEAIFKDDKDLRRVFKL